MCSGDCYVGNPTCERLVGAAWINGGVRDERNDMGAGDLRDEADDNAQLFHDSTYSANLFLKFR